MDKSLIDRLGLGTILTPVAGYDMLHVQMQAREVTLAAQTHAVLALEIFEDEAKNLDPEFRDDLATLCRVFGEIWNLCQAYAQQYVRTTPEATSLWEVSSNTLNHEVAQRLATTLRSPATCLTASSFFEGLAELKRILGENEKYLEVSREFLEERLAELRDS